MSRSAESAIDNSQGCSERSERNPWTLGKLMRALKGRKMFLSPFQGLDQFDTFPGVALAPLATPLAIVYRAFSAHDDASTKSVNTARKLKTEN
jgi:hypothetical protein